MTGLTGALFITYLVVLILIIMVAVVMKQNPNSFLTTRN